MVTARSQQPLPIGFLSVLDDEELGAIGGYLVLNRNGRPLEFHCTSPVRANRAQQILYGPTLQPFLCGEQIAPALLKKAKSKTALVCTDVTAAMTVRLVSGVPVALVSGNEAKHDADGWSAPRLNHFSLADRDLAVLEEHADDEKTVVAELSDLPETIDLQEPFERIREAIEEAQSGLRNAAGR